MSQIVWVFFLFHQRIETLCSFFLFVFADKVLVEKDSKPQNLQNIICFIHTFIMSTLTITTKQIETTVGKLSLQNGKSNSVYKIQ